MSGDVQLSLDGGLDPVEVSKLQAPARELYRSLNLDACQIDAIEAAVRNVLAGQYARRYGRRRAA